MTLVTNLEGSSYSTVIRDSYDWPMRADSSVSSGQFLLADDDGTLNPTHFKDAYVEETACVSAPRIFMGAVGETRFRRSGGIYFAAASREVQVQILDLNERFHRLIIGSYSDGKRPAETDIERIDWLLSTYLSGLLVDNGLVFRGHPRPLEEADFTRRYADDVMSDMCSTIGVRTYFAYWDQTLGASLFYDTPSAITFTSTLSISNVASDVDNTTVFAPSADAELTRDPSEIYSKIILKYRNGQILRNNTLTQSTYTNRGFGTESDRISLLSTAENRALQFLDQHAGPHETITCSLKLPKESVGLIQAGMRIAVRFSEFPGFDGALGTTYLRITARDIKPTPNNNPDEYEVDLELDSYGLSSGNVGGGGTSPGTFPTPPPVPCPDWDPDTGGTFVISGAGYGLPEVFSDDLNPLWYLNMDPNRRYHWTANASGTNTPIAAVRFARRTTHALWLVQGGGGGGGMRFTAGWDLPVPYLEYAASDANGTTYADPPLDVLCPHSLGSGLACDPAASNCGSIDTGQMVVSVYDSGAPHGATSISVTFTCRVYDCDGNLLTCTTADPVPPQPGQPVLGETPTPAADGSTMTFTTTWPFADGSLKVYVDLLDQTAAVTSYDGAAGTFTLGFAPAVGESITVEYQGR